MSKRLRVILKRWRDVAFTALLAAVIWYMCGPAVDALLEPVVEHLGSYPLALLWPALVIISLGASVPIAAGRWKGWLGVRHLLSYPPLWVAVLAAMLFAALLNAWSLRWSFLVLPAAIVHVACAVGVSLFAVIVPVACAVGVSLFVVIVIVYGFDEPLAHTPNVEAPQASEPSISELVQDFDALLRWIRTDDEVNEPEMDLFGHDAVARRIVRRLTEDHGSGGQTVALIGGAGSGKSTIAALVQYHLKAHEQIRVIRLSLWPYESPEAAVAGILKAVMRELSRQVNTLAILGLSGEYISAIERAGGFWGGLANLLKRPCDPQGILRQLSDIATAINLRIVLWIEDLERFAGTQRLAGDPGQLREAERLGPVRALLYLLNQADRISVIVADTTLESRFDLDKIARFVERPPAVEIAQAWKAIALLRDRCLDGYPKTILDPVHPGRREELHPPTAAEMMLRPFRADGREPPPHEALVTLLGTPRSLKNALRVTVDAWEQLCGEIDLDDVLVMSAIRVARPHVFAFVDDHIEAFRHGFPGGFDPLGKEPRGEDHPTYKAFEELLDKQNDVRVAKAIKSLVGFVFPTLPEPAFRADPDRIYVDRPQGLSVHRHVDYWQRYLAIPDIPKSESDQAALRTIKAWKRGEPSDLVHRLLDGKRCDQVETFVRLFRGADLCRLLEEVVCELQLASAESWRDQSSAPGTVSVERMMHRLRPPEDTLGETVTRLMRALVPSHLPLARDILDHFVAVNPTNELLSAEQSRTIIADVRALVRDSFPKGSGQSLLAALQNGSPHTLGRIVTVIRTEPADGEPFDGWSTFASVLLEAARIDPDRTLVHVIPFVTRGYDRDAGPSDNWEDGPYHRKVFGAQFDEQAARRLFDFEGLVPLLAEATTPEWVDGNMRAQFDAARDYARQVRSRV